MSIDLQRPKRQTGITQSAPEPIQVSRLTQLARTSESSRVAVTWDETPTPEKLCLELHDVQDLAYGLPDFGRFVSIARDLEEHVEDERPFNGDELAVKVKTAVDPGLWDEADGKSIAFSDGLLIVRNTAAVQRRVATYLADLRAGLPRR